MGVVTAAFNVRPDGSIVMDGEHSPGVSAYTFDQLAIACSRIDVGHYQISGPGIALPDGWRCTVYRDENDEPTVRVSLSPGDGVIDVVTTDRATGAAKDIVYLLTLRVAVTFEPPADPEPHPAAESSDSSSAQDVAA